MKLTVATSSIALLSLVASTDALAVIRCSSSRTVPLIDEDLKSSVTAAAGPREPIETAFSPDRLTRTLRPFADRPRPTEPPKQELYLAYDPDGEVKTMAKQDWISKFPTFVASAVTVPLLGILNHKKSRPEAVEPDEATVTSSGPQKRDAKGETVSTEAIQKLAKALEATGTVSLARALELLQGSPLGSVPFVLPNGNGPEGTTKESRGIWILFSIGDFMGDGDEAKKPTLEASSEDPAPLATLEPKPIEEGAGSSIEKTQEPPAVQDAGHVKEEVMHKEE